MDPRPTSLKIGPIELPNRVLLAPMSGVSDLPFRHAVKEQGAGLVFSEMLASKAIIHGNRRTKDKAEAVDGGLAVQLAGNEPDLMAEAARISAGRGARIIDINMGCPVKKITKGNGGAALMRDEVLAGRIIEAVVSMFRIIFCAVAALRRVEPVTTSDPTTGAMTMSMQAGFCSGGLQVMSAVRAPSWWAYSSPART